jgi:hypothetical protein
MPPVLSFARLLALPFARSFALSHAQPLARLPLLRGLVQAHQLHDAVGADGVHRADQYGYFVLI